LVSAISYDHAPSPLGFSIRTHDVWPTVPPAITESALDNDIHTSAHGVKCSSNRRFALLDISEIDDVPTLSAQRFNEGFFVLEATLEHDLEKRIIELRATALAVRLCHLARRAMAAAQKVRQVRGGKREAVVRLAHDSLPHLDDHDFDWRRTTIQVGVLFAGRIHVEPVRLPRFPRQLRSRAESVSRCVLGRFVFPSRHPFGQFDAGCNHFDLLQESRMHFLLAVIDRKPGRGAHDPGCLDASRTQLGAHRARYQAQHFRHGTVGRAHLFVIEEPDYLRKTRVMPLPAPRRILRQVPRSVAERTETRIQSVETLHNSHRSDPFFFQPIRSAARKSLDASLFAGDSDERRTSDFRAVEMWSCRDERVGGRVELIDTRAPTC